MSKLLHLIYNSPRAHEVFDILLHSLRGAKHAGIYGAQVRLPHLLITAMIAKTSGTSADKLRRLITRAGHMATRQTCFLGMFAFLYRFSSTVLQRWTGDSEKRPLNSFVCGALSCALVYRSTESDSMQLYYFLMARVLSALANVAVEKGYVSKAHPQSYFLLFGLSGGLIMWLFEHHRSCLTPNIQYSMKYIYEM